MGVVALAVSSGEFAMFISLGMARSVVHEALLRSSGAEASR